jgi:hypothetical protein
MGKIIMKLYFAGILLMLTSCRHPSVTFEKKLLHGDSVLIKRIFDKQGIILKEEQFSVDSILNGSYKEFYKGILKTIGSYENGKKNGTWYNLDLKGDTIDVSNWFSGKLFGEQLTFYMQGSPNSLQQLYKYSFLGLEENKLFEETFDLQGKRTNITGFPVYCVYNKSDIPKDSVFELICFFGIPPKATYKLIVYEKNKTSEKMESHEKNDKEIVDVGYAKKFLFRKKYVLQGDYSWTIKLKINDVNGQLVCNDSTTIDIKVR